MPDGLSDGTIDSQTAADAMRAMFSILDLGGYVEYTVRLYDMPTWRTWLFRAAMRLAAWIGGDTVRVRNVPHVFGRAPEKPSAARIEKYQTEMAEVTDSVKAWLDTKTTESPSA